MGILITLENPQVNVILESPDGGTLSVVDSPVGEAQHRAVETEA
jgi:hypothetical protein